jgi:hypothetical protein
MLKESRRGGKILKNCQSVKRLKSTLNGKESAGQETLLSLKSY